MNMKLKFFFKTWILDCNIFKQLKTSLRVDTSFKITKRPSFIRELQIELQE